MNSKRHRMGLAQRTGTELVFICPEEGCGRTLVIDTSDCGLTVIIRGDPLALHHGTTGEVELSADIEPTSGGVIASLN